MSASSSDSGESSKPPDKRKKKKNKAGNKANEPEEKVSTKASEAVAATSEVSTLASNSTVTPKPMKAPKLLEVVKAASNINPVPCPQVNRPPVGRKGAVTSPKEPSTITLSSRVAVGLSYAQQVGGGSNKSSIIEIQGNYVAPRSPPSEAGKPRPKSDEGMQGVFNGRWQDDRYGMHFEHIRGSTQSAYLKAIGAVIPRENIFSFGLIGRGLVEVFTTDLESATKLMLEGIDVAGRHLSGCPVSIKPTRVTFSRVPMRTDHEDLATFLKRFGTVHGKVRAIPLKVGEEGLGRGIFSTSREAFITLNKGCVLPHGFYLNVAGSKSWIGVETEAKCHACHQVGHFVAECPKRARRATEAVVKETSAPAAASDATVSQVAAPDLEGPPVIKVSENFSKEAKPNSAVSGLIPTRESVTSSDEEPTTSSKARKKLTRKKPKSRASREEIMPPPLRPLEKGASKRRHSEEDTDARSLKVQAVDTQSVSACPSDIGSVKLDGEVEPLLSGYESCNSTTTGLSLGATLRWLMS